MPLFVLGILKCIAHFETNKKIWTDSFSFPSFGYFDSMVHVQKEKRGVYLIICIGL